MAKYKFEFKKKVVFAYLNNKGSYVYLAKKYNIPAHHTIEKRVHAYNESGDTGLLRSRKNNNYSFEFKLHVVELYLTTEVSYQELALSVGINNPALLAKWVTDFQSAGPDALRPKRKGRRRTVNKPKDIQTTCDSDSDTKETTEYIQQLEDDLLKLRIENAYLKELRRLRIEEETRLRE